MTAPERIGDLAAVLLARTWQRQPDPRTEGAPPMNVTEHPTRDWEPSYGFCATRDSDPIVLAAALEYVRRRTCAYGPNAKSCDCKMGVGRNLTEGDTRLSSEQTGCVELREVIHKLLHRGGSVNPDREEWLERQLAEERRSAGEVAESMAKRIRDLVDALAEKTTVEATR